MADELRDRRSYETDALRVHWDSSRCIHTGICLRTLPSVFDTGRRPWVDLSDTQASAVADAVEHCPTGALRYERLDGAEGERPRRPTLIRPIRNGPLLMAGDMDVRGPDREPITNEARLTLCRCGLSHNQPFCDNSHRAPEVAIGTNGGATRAAAPAAGGCWGGADDCHRAPRRIARGARRPAHLPLRRTGDARGRPGAAVSLRAEREQAVLRSQPRAEFRSRPPQTLRERIEAETPAAFASNPEVPDPHAAGGA